MVDAPIILFDGICNFCNYWVNFILKHDKSGTIRFASLQGENGKKIQTELNINSSKIDSVILVFNQKAYFYSDAVIGIGQQMGGIYKASILFKIVPRPLRDFIYKYIAKNRYSWFGQRDACMIPTKEVKSRFLI